ncbi:MAG: hypothetical protein HKN72_15825 [Gemmatimonadetes bacterium]|nr:hypothetical protein [Gemmatimonadota bacterium]NNF14696.1 hypothetical protein [Gemmatimonadota bacterium]
MRRRTTPLAVTAFLTVALPLAADAQDWTRREFPLAPPNANDNFVAPYFDGFYENEDGTFTISFGFMNRNDEELIEIALGPDNFLEPAELNGNQPTAFPTVQYSGFGGYRERGAFGVVVPADFEGDVWWTLSTNGYTTRVPGRLESPGRIVKGAYELSTSPMAAGSLRPGIRFTEDGPMGAGVRGIFHPETLTAQVGEPVELVFWAHDRGDRELGPVNVTLWKHQGPVGGKIAFESFVPAPPEVEGRRQMGRAPGPGPVETRESVELLTDGPMAYQGHFSATFDTPGEYVIRIRADNFSQTDSTPGNQCCWTNGYVRVSVND